MASAISASSRSSSIDDWRLANVNAEFSLTSLAYNMRRAINILGIPALLRAVQA